MRALIVGALLCWTGAMTASISIAVQCYKPLIGIAMLALSAVFVVVGVLIQVRYR